jgi:predicted Zn-dependent peptidase
MLMEGTKKWSAQELRARLDHMGARMECGSGKFTAYLRMTALPEHLQQSLELAADALIRPTFPSSRLEKVRQNLLAEIRSERENWQREAWYFLQRSFYGGHPYGLSPVGTEEAVKDVEVDDLRALFAECFRGGNGVLAVYGDLDVDRTKELVLEAFSDLPAGELGDVSIPAPEPVVADTTVWRVNDKGQLVVCVGLNGVSMGDDDRYALDVLDAVTSGVNLPGGWLHEALRGDADLAYFVHLMPAWGPTSGNIVVMAQTSVANREHVVASIQAELDRAGQETIGPDELEAGKATCVAAHAIYHQDPGSQADEAALFELYGFGHDFMDSYARSINAVTAQDVQRVAQQYFGARVLAMTGPAEAFQGLP